MIVKPTIWRRIQVPEDFTFRQLHVAIQHAMGWSSSEIDYQSHLFEMKNPNTSKRSRIGIRGSTSPKPLDENKIKISNYFNMDGNERATYEYDFGCCWWHDIVLEEIKPAEANTVYPKCTDGERACPPEGSGGPSAYQYLVEIMANPDHDDYQEKKEWLEEYGTLGEDGRFDPEKFDLRYVLGFLKIICL